MTDSAKRIAVIKDLLVNLPKTRVAHMIYVINVGQHCLYDINHAREHCKVCLLGGLFLSYIDLYKQDLINSVESIDLLYHHLHKIFDEHQLNLIECSFEQRDVNSYFHDRVCDNAPHELEDIEDDCCPGCEELIRAFTFAPKLKGAERIKAILENMLANDGIFVP